MFFIWNIKSTKKKYNKWNAVDEIECLEGKHSVKKNQFFFFEMTITEKSFCVVEKLSSMWMWRMKLTKDMAVYFTKFA